MKSALIVAIALASAPVAMAQTVCEEVAVLNASGLHRFDSIRGALVTEESDDKLYESKTPLLGAEGCLIDQFFEPRLTCSWSFETAGEALAAYADKAAAVALCLADWERSDLLVHDEDKPYRVLIGAGYLGAGVYEPIVWAMFADFDVARDGGRYRLVIEVTDYT